jgi:hypothetical protein
MVVEQQYLMSLIMMNTVLVIRITANRIMSSSKYSYHHNFRASDLRNLTSLFLNMDFVVVIFTKKKKLSAIVDLNFLI